MNQDFKYDFTADLTGTGDRSEYEKYVKQYLCSVSCRYGQREVLHLRPLKLVEFSILLFKQCLIS